MRHDRNVTPLAHRAGWHRRMRERRQAGRPAIVEIPATLLRRGDVLAGGGTITSTPSQHPCGVVTAEVDYQTLSQWAADRQVHVYEREGGR